MWTGSVRCEVTPDSTNIAVLKLFVCTFGCMYLWFADCMTLSSRISLHFAALILLSVSFKLLNHYSICKSDFFFQQYS